MSELLNAAAANMGIPEALVQRAAAARASDTGTTVDEVLSAWSGGGAIAPSTSSSAPASTESPSAAEAPEPSSETTDEPPATVPAASTPADVVPPAAAAAAATRAPVPTEVNIREAARLPEVVTVPTAGIREKTNSTIPRWLTTLLLAAPLFALFALGGLATGECGEATELRTDVVTGEIVNCDGSEFTGSGGPGGGPDFIGVGERIYAGAEMGGVNCASCHGAQGQGLGTFPGMGGVMTVFSSCQDHIEWVTLGADGFRAQGRQTYGDTQRPVSAMPAFGGRLSEEQIAAVVAFERVRFGGGDRDQVGVDCGLVEAENGEDPDGELNDDEEAGAYESRRGAIS